MTSYHMNQTLDSVNKPKFHCKKMIPKIGFWMNGMIKTWNALLLRTPKLPMEPEALS